MARYTLGTSADYTRASMTRLPEENGTDRVHIEAIGADGSGVTGLSPQLTIINQSTGQYWNGTSFQVSFTQVSMVEFDSVNAPGLYTYDFTPGADAIVTYRAEATFEGIPRIWTGEAQFGEWVDDVVTTRKYVRNKFAVSGSAYTIYEDDKATPFETGTVSQTDREPS